MKTDLNAVREYIVDLRSFTLNKPPQTREADVIESMADDIDSLRAALTKYGEHQMPCIYARRDSPSLRTIIAGEAVCSCGLDEARR